MLEKAKEINGRLLNQGFNLMGNSVWQKAEKPQWFGNNCIDGTETLKAELSELGGHCQIHEYDSLHRVCIWHAPDGEMYLFDPAYWLKEPLKITPGVMAYGEAFPHNSQGKPSDYWALLNRDCLTTEWEISDTRRLVRSVFELDDPVNFEGYHFAYLKKLSGLKGFNMRHINLETQKALRMQVETPKGRENVRITVREGGGAYKDVNPLSTPRELAQLAEVLGVAPEEIVIRINEAVDEVYRIRKASVFSGIFAS